MSSMSTKVRPTFTIAELRLLSQGTELLMNKHIQAGDFQNPILLTLMRLKDYCVSFQPVASTVSDQERLAAYIQSQGINSSIIPGTALIQATEEFSEPMELTDEQRFDLLKLRDDSTYSEDDKVFMLNVGTMIMIRRAGIKSVDAGDL